MAEQMIQHKEGEKVATQAIPTGYKQTEVGVIPKDWEVMLVGDSFTVCNNLRLPISSKVRDGMSGSYPYYGPTKIQSYINEYRVEGEYALIGEDGDHFLKFDSVNQTQLVCGKFNVNNHAHLIKGNIGSAKWFYWFFINRDISIYLTRQGAGRFKLNKASLERIQCAIPPMEEQLAITTVLSDSDALIVSLEQLIAKKQAIKTATMQQLLTGRTRLPPFSKRSDGTPKGYKQSELGQIPEDWGINSINKVGSIITGSTPPTAVGCYWDGDIPWITPTDIGDAKNIFESERRITEKGLQEIRGLPANSVLVTCIASIGKNAILKNAGACNQQINAIVPTALFDVDFLYYNIEFSKERLRQCAGITATPIISKALFSDFLLPFPSNKEQTAIATILSDMDSELQALEQKLAKARDVKQGMMQQLLTGRIRLPLEVVA
ncbi:restriction endonuclease subunit S [Aeromonas veronii]|uniref:restriction endonuclease subunit S n=1 Tax=Aeromonas veronii TaxID=654 RepID=UPI003D23D24D